MDPFPSIKSHSIVFLWLPTYWWHQQRSNLEKWRIWATMAEYALTQQSLCSTALVTVLSLRHNTWHTNLMEEKFSWFIPRSPDWNTETSMAEGPTTEESHSPHGVQGAGQKEPARDGDTAFWVTTPVTTSSARPHLPTTHLATTSHDSVTFQKPYL